MNIYIKKRLEELKIHSMILLHKMDIPTLAILYENSPGITQIKTYYIILKEKKIIDTPWSPQNVDSSANRMVAVPAGKKKKFFFSPHHIHTYISK